MTPGPEFRIFTPSEDDVWGNQAREMICRGVYGWGEQALVACGWDESTADQLGMWLDPDDPEDLLPEFHGYGSPGCLLAVGSLLLNRLAESRIILDTLVVSSAYRYQGYGSLMIEHLQVRAVSLGAARMDVCSSKKAVQFYINHNYRLVSAEDDVYDMVKPLVAERANY